MEEVVAPQTMNSAGFEPPRIRQFTVFMENRVGRFQALVRTIEETGIKIMTIAIEESAESSLVRLITSNADETRKLLEDGRFFFTESDLLAAELPKRSKEPLLTLSAVLLSVDINIHYAYPMLVRQSPALVLYVDDPTLAGQLLIRKGFRLLAESDMK